MELLRTKPSDKDYFGYYDPRYRLPEDHIQSLTEDGVNWLLMTVVNIELAEGHKAGLTSEDLLKKISKQWKFCENWIKADAFIRECFGPKDETTDL
jgi:hypothetical protein